MSAQAVAEKLYEHFGKREGRGMAALYAPDATFDDPAFPGLRGPRVGAMWRMLTKRAKDLALTVDELTATENTATVKWTATYTFSATGRKVKNHVTSTIDVQSGFIVKQVDVFDFHAWARQALGPAGLFLGWTSFFRKKVQANAAKGLDEFIAKEG